MNRAIFWRLFWKEYRLQRSLWIAMAVLTAMLLLLFYEFVENPRERAEWILWTALALPAFYALGCGATLFAGEKEAGTFEFQRAAADQGMAIVPHQAGLCSAEHGPHARLDVVAGRMVGQGGDVLGVWVAA